MADDKKKDKKFQTLFRLVQKRLKDTPDCHGFDHTLRVMRNAELLVGACRNVKSDVVRFGALLHDIARPEEVASRGRKDHAKIGAEMAKVLLMKQGFGESFADAVAECVRTHRYRANEEPVSVEARIVYDADKLDSLGAVGIGRAFHFAGYAGAKLHNTTEEALKSRSYGKNDTAYREYLVKLRNLPEVMRTGAGRRIALERVEFMHEFFAQLNEECNMPEPQEC